MAELFPMRRCPKCGHGGPTLMVFKYKGKKRDDEYSYICCDVNTGHKKTIPEALEAWNILAQEEYDEQKEA